MENVALMQKAKESLRGNWGVAIGTFLVYGLVIGVPAGILNVGLFEGSGNIITLFIASPLALGIAIFSLALARNQEATFGQLFEGFQHYTKALITYLLVVIFVFLWTLLLIVPGIIASIAYSMTFYILADDKEIKPMEAIRKSKEMMYGYKWKLFRLSLRFILLSLLCILTLGIGFLWLMPYMYVTLAHFYEDVKNKNIAR